jgi:F-type H+-transporting ATPase subunit gamma
MANRRILVKRRKAVRNIRKITRTMQLIATARFQAALQRAVASRPYTEKLADLVRELSHASGGAEHPLMRAVRGSKRHAILILTSSRGLCGGYNAGVLRTALARLNELAQQSVETDVHMVGKKGVGYFRFLKRPVAERILTIGDTPKFTEVEPLAASFMQRFTQGAVASVEVAYMRFLSAGRQRPEILTLLPLSQESRPGAGPTEMEEVSSRRRAEHLYEFSPSPAELLRELLPASVRVRLFQCFNDAKVSEHIARMVAMKAATDSAGRMIRTLTRRYNRARQTQITMELLDIVGGANALT